MRTRFNHATVPLENNRRFVALSGVLGVAALAVLLLLSMHVVHLRRANREMRTSIDRLQREINVSLRQQEGLREEFKSTETVEAMKRSQFLNGLIEERAFPWTKMFADLEGILPPGVRVISISPHMDKEGKVKVVFTIGAADDDQKIKFLNAIDSSPAFADVTVMQEARPRSEKLTNGGSDKVLLNLEARYSTI